MATNNDTSTFTLNGTNFLDWSRNLRIVLKQEKKSYVLEPAFHPIPPSNGPKAQKDD